MGCSALSVDLTAHTPTPPSAVRAQELLHCKVSHTPEALLDSHVSYFKDLKKWYDHVSVVPAAAATTAVVVISVAVIVVIVVVVAVAVPDINDVCAAVPDAHTYRHEHQVSNATQLQAVALHRPPATAEPVRPTGPAIVRRRNRCRQHRRRSRHRCCDVQSRHHRQRRVRVIDTVAGSDDDTSGIGIGVGVGRWRVKQWSSRCCRDAVRSRGLTRQRPSARARVHRCAGHTRSRGIRQPRGAKFLYVGGSGGGYECGLGRYLDSTFDVKSHCCAVTWALSMRLFIVLTMWRLFPRLSLGGGGWAVCLCDLLSWLAHLTHSVRMTSILKYFKHAGWREHGGRAGSAPRRQLPALHKTRSPRRYRP